MATLPLGMLRSCGRQAAVSHCAAAQISRTHQKRISFGQLPEDCMCIASLPERAWPRQQRFQFVV